MIQPVTADQFDSVLQSHPLIVIDFWATWCGPCKVFSKILEEVSSRYPEFFFASVDVDAEKTLAEEFSIRSVPFVMIIRDRVIVYAESGVLQTSALSELLDQAKTLKSK